MIANDEQLRVTKQRLLEFRESLNSKSRTDIDPVLAKAAKLQIENQIMEFEKEIAEYALKKYIK